MQTNIDNNQSIAEPNSDTIDSKQIPQESISTPPKSLSHKKKSHLSESDDRLASLLQKTLLSIAHTVANLEIQKDEIQRLTKDQEELKATLKKHQCKIIELEMRHGVQLYDQSRRIDTLANEVHNLTEETPELEAIPPSRPRSPPPQMYS